MLFAWTVFDTESTLLQVTATASPHITHLPWGREGTVLIDHAFFHQDIPPLSVRPSLQDPLSILLGMEDPGQTKRDPWPHVILHLSYRSMIFHSHFYNTHPTPASLLCLLSVFPQLWGSFPYLFVFLFTSQEIFAFQPLKFPCWGHWFLDHLCCTL